jgi:Protein of unknown function (DUF3179)
MVDNNCSVNAPLDRALNTPLRILVQSDRVSCKSKRRYTKAHQVRAVAVEKFKRSGTGITFEDLISSGLAPHKSQSQDTLKRCHRKNILFVIENLKPQRYYPYSLKSEIIKARLSKNAQVRVTEVPYLQKAHFSSNDAILTQTLADYVLPILHNLPVNIHKIQLRLKLGSEYYGQIPLPVCPSNRSKEHQEIVGSGTLVRYLFYPNGTVMVFVECGNIPFRLEEEDDFACMIAFLGAVRDRLVVFLHDTHERVVPDMMQWYNGQALQLKHNPQNKNFLDMQTGSEWNFEGVAINGQMKGKQLTRLPFDEGFWFEWVAFHPRSELYFTK